MDYRYNVTKEGRKFHKKRRAFIIINNNIEFLPKGSSMLHYEYCKSKNIDVETYNKITRGYYIDKNVVFYKDNFIYDDKLIKESLNFLDIISKKVGIQEFAINYGLQLDNNFAYTYNYGTYRNGKITINNYNKGDI